MKKLITILAITLSLIITVCIISIKISYDKGIDKGFEYAILTVDTMLDRKIKSRDSTVLRFVIIHPKDTNTYYLSNKHLWRKFK